MTLHLQHTPNLHQINHLPIPQTHNLIKRAKQLKAILQYLPLVRAPAHVRHDAREEVQRLDVLQDVRRFVRDEHDVEVLERLVDVAHVGRLDGGVLRVCGDEFGEGGEEGFDPGARHFAELARDDGYIQHRIVIMICMST